MTWKKSNLAKKRFLFDLYLYVLIGFLASHVLGAQPSIKAVRIDTPPKIDGILNDPAWEKAAVIDQFYQREPDTGEPVSQKTVVYICYSEKQFFVGFKCYDDPDRITAKELKRDISLGEDDRVQIILDTFLDKRNGYWFQIGPRGSIGDALVSENGAGFNKEWDGLWEGKARIHEQGWDAEIAIPFKTLSFRPDQHTWGLKLIRHIRRRLESAYWPVANLNTYRFQVSDGGLITGIENISQGFGLDIRPYGLLGMNQKYEMDNKFIYDAGGDIFYQISSGLNAALTINTDFAQTEVDSRQINLTRFALFFPEKRNFFLDGANYFNFGFGGDDENHYNDRMIPYFSRRIGLDEDGNPVPIIGGVKLAGQAGNWNIGALNITDKTDTAYRNFTVARITHNIGRQSYIGFIGTKGDASGTRGNWISGVDVKLATSHFKGNKNLVFTGFGIKSNTNDLDGQQFTFGADLNYPNDLLNFRIGHQQIGENYHAGIGFVPRPGIREYYSSLFIGPRPERFGILKINTGAMIDYITSMRNKLLTRDLFLKVAELEFLSGERIEYALHNTYEFLDKDFLISSKDSVSIAGGAYDYWQQSIEAYTARRRKFWIGSEIDWGSFYSGKIAIWKILWGWKIGVPFFVGMETEQNFVMLPEGNFTTRIYRINGDIYFNPDISLSNFIQYDNLSENWGWQSRFRWILKPGKEIYLVWNSIMQRDITRERMIFQENIMRFKVNYSMRF